MEFAEFLSMKETAGVQSQSAFIKARIFNETFRVIKVDRSLLDYYQKTDDFVRTVSQRRGQLQPSRGCLKSNFTEKKAYAMLAQLEKLTLELAAIGGEIVQLTREFQEKWSQK